MNWLKMEFAHLACPLMRTAAVAMKCKCGSRAEFKEFASFNYWYCAKCKIEVVGKDNPSPFKYLRPSYDLFEQMKAIANEFGPIVFSAQPAKNPCHEVLLDFDFKYYKHRPQSKVD